VIALDRAYATRTLRLVAREAKVNVMLSLEYRAGFFIFMFNTMAQPTLSLLLWLAVRERSVTNNAATGGLPFDRPQLVTYFVLMALVSLFTSVWISEYISADIRTGRLSRDLLRPAPVIAGKIGNNLGEKLVKLGLLFPFVALVAVVFRQDFRPPTDPLTWLLVALSVLMAAAMNFLVDYLLGSLAFWVQDVTGLVAFQRLIAQLLAGRFIPLAFFPVAFAPFLAVQPWRLLLSFPLEIATGTVAGTALWTGLALQAGYVLALVAAHHLVWHYGLRSYVGTGA
jgi:ABC-2 type transport system permease protein